MKLASTVIVIGKDKMKSSSITPALGREHAENSTKDYGLIIANASQIGSGGVYGQLD
jgi:hypothetical protein